MEAVLNLKASATGSGTSPAICLAGYGNSAGSGRSILRLDWRINRNDGTLASVLVQHSADNSTWATLWDCGSLTGDQYKYLYTFNEWLRLSYSYTVGSSAYDTGARVTFRVLPFGAPDWYKTQASKWSVVEGLDPEITDTARNFQREWPEQMALAKRDLELAMRSRAVDPHRVPNDGHNSEPTIPGLELAGALRTLYYIWLNLIVSRNEAWQRRLEALDIAYKASLDAAFESGILSVDVDSDAALSPTERVIQTRRILR